MRAIYTAKQKFIHWTTFVLVLGLYGITYAESLFGNGTPERAAVWWLHISFGLLLIPLVLWRVAVRAARPKSSMIEQRSGLEHVVAKIVHAALYVLLIAIPILGVVLAWLRGDALSFFGMFTIPAPFASNRELAHLVQEIHGILAHVIIALAAVHALAALWHHFGRRDDILKRMLPGKAFPASNVH